MATWKKVIVSGSDASLNSLSVATNVTAASFTGSFSGSLDGNATTATTASYALTASFAQNVVNQISTGSLLTTASFSNPNLTFTKGDGTTFSQSLVTLVPTSASFASTAALATTVTTNADLTGDVTSVGNATTLASVASAGTTGGSTAIPVITINAKGLTTSITTAAVIAPAGTLTGTTLASNVTGSSLTSVGTLAGVTITGTSALTTLTVSGDATITGNLSVAGTASFTNTDNLNIKDKFILINSGSGVLADSGWVTQYNAAGSGSAFYLEASSAGTYGRFAMAYDVIGTSTSLTPDEFVVSAKITGSAPPANPTWGGSTNGSGNIHVNSSTGEIFIYA